VSATLPAAEQHQPQELDQPVHRHGPQRPRPVHVLRLCRGAARREAVRPEQQRGKGQRHAGPESAEGAEQSGVRTLFTLFYFVLFYFMYTIYNYTEHRANWYSQRAFRERKERHVRELEQKLTDLQAKSMSLHADNERLKRELAKIVSENEILRATGDSSGQSSPDEPGSSNDDNNDNNNSNNVTTANGPTKYLPTDMRKTIADIQKTGSLPHRIVLSSESGDRLLNARATWDFIQAHPLYKKGLIDIGDVCERLKNFTRCDGQGPVYEQGRVQKAIEESVACGNDELI
jgi:AP-1-like transcription factor